ncbi:MAG: flagellin [Verrucomicrobia bacterium]|nr:flagellin [Verrucomicrobiota bacterium]
MVINANLPALNSTRLLAESSQQLARSLARLSSGNKIVSPDDDAAGLAVSLRMEAQTRRIEAANNNLVNAISFSQTQDGFLGKAGRALARMGELAVLAQDTTKSNADRSLYDQEFQTLAEYLSHLARKDFNGVSLFSGNTLGVTQDGEGDTFPMVGLNLSNTTYTDATSSNISTTGAALTALSYVRTAVSQVTADRGTVGANLARLQATSDQLSLLGETLTQAVSRIKDADVAVEATDFARYNILVQAGTAMLAQANTAPAVVLRLIS